MKKTLLLFILLATIFYSNLEAQVTTGSFVHDGVLREYRLYLPPNYQGFESLPLIFNLHGFGSNMLQQDIYSGLNLVADTAKFFICTPQGFQDSWNVGWLIGSTKDDVGFINALIDTISAEYNVDLNAVFSTGMSNGGFMSYRLACELDDRIRAVASVAGGMEEGQTQICSPNAPTPVMQIHGTADDVVLYNGTAFVSIAVENLISQWVDRNGCLMDGDTIPVPDIAPNDGATAERIEYNDCNGESRVVFYKVTGGGHSWPGAPQIPDLDPTCQDFKASHEIWLFFKQYTTPLIPVSNRELVINNEVDVNPNPFNDFLNVESQKGIINSIVVYNAIGQQVFYRSEIRNQNFQIPTSGLQKGVYFINIETSEGVAVLKTIKQ